MKAPPVVEKRIEAPDGTRLAYHSVGDGPTVLLANGLGGSWKAWTYQIQYLRDRYRFLSWDYRGLYGSGPSRNGSMAVPTHAADGFRVVDDATEEPERPITIMAWSMGVQVALEMFRKAPERVAALVLINGVAGRPWNSVFDTRALAPVFPYALRTARRYPEFLERTTRRVVRWPETVTWAKRLGFASSTVDNELWTDLAESFADLDMTEYVRILENLGEHDAHDMLGTVDVPTLVIAGARDRFTPRSTMERIVRSVPGAEFMIVPGGTHYVAVEHPEMVNLRIEKFLLERGYAPEQGPE